MKVRAYHKALLQSISNHKLWATVLGVIDGFPMWFIRNHPSPKGSVPRLLIASGFHGEESAGPLAILKWLQEFDPNLYRNVNLSIVPIVCPSAFNNKTRYAIKGVRTNCGFCHPENGDQPSREGVVLIKNAQLLKASAKDGFLSLHEDKDQVDKFYLYTFERTEEPGIFTESIRNVEAKFFKPLENEVVTTDASGGKGVLVQNGVVYRLCDGSFEDWLFHEGTEFAVATETPGSAPLKTRVSANIAIIQEFIQTCTRLRDWKT